MVPATFLNGGRWKDEEPPPKAKANGRASPFSGIEEFERRIRAPLLPEEIEEAQALYRWFTRRYPTAAERLAYIKRKYREWTRPISGTGSD